MVHLHNLVPLALHEQYVAIAQTVVAQLFLDIVFVAANAEDVYRIVFAQSGVAYAHTSESRGGQNDDFGDADVVEVQSGGLHPYQVIVAGKPLHGILVAIEVEYVALGDDGVCPRHTLAYVHAESLLLLVAYLEYGESIPVLQVELLHTHACEPIVLVAHTILVQVVVQLVLLGEVVERLAASALVVLALLLDEQQTHGQQHGYAQGYHYQTDGEEGEEPERCEAMLFEGLADYKVWGRTYQGEHAAEAARKGHRHEQTRGAYARTGCHAHDDGHHDGHGAGVAHKGADERGGEDHIDEGARLVALGHARYAVACRLGKTRLQDGTAHDEEAGHHNDYGRRKTA